MVSEVLKRDGRRVPFDETRIRTAIELAITDSNINGLDKQTVVDNIINEVKTKISNSIETEIDVETIQNYVVQSMKALKLSKLAKSYTSYRNKRTRIREKKSSLMRSIDEMNNATAKSSDSKRENANIDGDTAMGTMLKFGTTASKEYYLNEVIPEEMSNAHREGYIHIHDLDFHSLTTTCLTSNTSICIKVNGETINTTFAYFDKYFNNNVDINNSQLMIPTNDNKIFIKSENDFTLVNWCSRRKVFDNEVVYEIQTETDSIVATENHIFPIDVNGHKSLVFAKNLKIGNSLYNVSNNKLCTITSVNIVDYCGFVYDIETNTHFFNANNLLVHNCTQIGIGKLLDKGFSTGHGHLRSPNSINTAAALACIAIQSNQNDQHK